MSVLGGSSTGGAIPCRPGCLPIPSPTTPNSRNNTDRSCPARHRPSACRTLRHVSHHHSTLQCLPHPPLPRRGGHTFLSIHSIHPPILDLAAQHRRRDRGQRGPRAGHLGALSPRMSQFFAFLLYHHPMGPSSQLHRKQPTSSSTLAFSHRCRTTVSCCWTKLPGRNRVFWLRGAGGAYLIRLNDVVLLLDLRRLLLVCHGGGGRPN